MLAPKQPTSGIFLATSQPAAQVTSRRGCEMPHAAAAAAPNLGINKASMSTGLSSFRINAISSQPSSLAGGSTGGTERDAVVVQAALVGPNSARA